MIYNWGSGKNLPCSTGPVLLSGIVQHCVRSANTGRKGWIIKCVLNENGDPFLNEDDEIETITLYGRVTVK